MTIQITLTETQSKILAELSESRGVTQQEILHEAITQFLAPYQAVARKRIFGSARGLIQIAPDFDEPLEDFKEYME